MTWSSNCTIFTPTSWRGKQTYSFSSWWINKVFVHTSCCMLPRLHIHCPSQRDLTTPRRDLHRDHRPCRLFANLCYLPSQRFFTPFGLKNTSISNYWYQVSLCDPYTIKWAGYLCDKWDNEAENLAEWQVNTLEGNLHMFLKCCGDWDETSSRSRQSRQATGQPHSTSTKIMQGTHSVLNVLEHGLMCSDLHDVTTQMKQKKTYGSLEFKIFRWRHLPALRAFSLCSISIRKITRPLIWKTCHNLSQIYWGSYAPVWFLPKICIHI